MGNAKQTTKKDDQPFSHYPLKDRIVSRISRTLFDNLTYTVRRGLLKGMKRKGGLSWIPDICGFARETAEHRFFCSLNVAGKVVFDVGAFEGLVTLFFARNAQHVVCYEPNPRNYARLCTNLELNRIQNVTVRRFGLGAKPGTAAMVWDSRMAGGATLATTGMSTTICRRADACHDEIQVTTLDRDLAHAQLPEPDLIKVDVEGFELQVLQGARHVLETKHPALYLEIHGETMNEKRANARAIVEYLNMIGYEKLVHVESGDKITMENCDLASQGHIFGCKGASALDYDSWPSSNTLSRTKSVL
jgi:FkbM family methyltransferase